MARKFAEPIDLQQLQLLNVQLQQLGSPPTAVIGQLWFNTADLRPQWNDGTSNWEIYPTVTTNTANTGVLRDGSGNFAAGTITANLTGVASEATTLDDGTLTYHSGSYYLNRANHTGTQLAATISDFISTVETVRLDQMAAPTSSVSFNSQNIINLANPINPQDAATKYYVDSVVSGLDVKGACYVATTTTLPSYTWTVTGGGTLTAMANGALVIDGVTLSTLGLRVLVQNETGLNQPYNGIYTITTVGTGSIPYVLTRAVDANTSTSNLPGTVQSGMFTFITNGTQNSGNGFVLVTDNPISLNTTPLTFEQFSGTGEIVAGNGISKTGNTLSVNATAVFTFTGGALDLAATGVTAGTYSYVTVNAQGQVTAGTDISATTGLVTKTATK